MTIGVVPEVRADRAGGVVLRTGSAGSLGRIAELVSRTRPGPTHCNGVSRHSAAPSAWWRAPAACAAVATVPGLALRVTRGLRPRPEEET